MTSKNTFRISLARDSNAPWGFRLSGGADLKRPLIVQMVNPESISEAAGLQPGDVILAVNGTNVYSCTHKEAQDMMIGAGNSFELTVMRGEFKQQTWKPAVEAVGAMPLAPTAQGQTFTQTSLKTAQPEDSHWDVKHNQTARGFGVANTMQNGSGPGVGGSGLTNPTPVGQPTGFNPSPLGQPSGFQSVSAPKPIGFKSVSAPITTPRPEGQPTGPPLNKCGRCGKLIVGVFVKAKGQPMCPGCFTCETCGCSLKNVGHFVIDNKLVCEQHARQAKAAQTLKQIGT